MEINPIYKFMKDNGLTQKDEATFVSEYSNPQKSAELHKFMVDNGLTTKGADDFYSEYFAGSKKKEPTTPDSSQPAKPSTQSFGQKITEKIASSATQIPLKITLQQQQEKEKLGAEIVTEFAKGVGKKEEERKQAYEQGGYAYEKFKEKEAVEGERIAKAKEENRKNDQAKTFVSHVVDKDVSQEPNREEAQGYASNIAYDYVDFLANTDPDRGLFLKDKYSKLKSLSPSDRNAEDERFLRQIESDALDITYRAKNQELSLAAANIDKLQKTAVTPSDISQLNYLYKKYERTKNSLNGIISTYNQNKQQYGDLIGMEMQSQAVKAERFKALQEGDAKTIEFFKGIGNAATNGIISLAQLPKVFGDLIGDTDYDWSDEMYDSISNTKKNVDIFFGNPLPEGKSMSDLPTAARIAVIGGNAIGSVGLFATGAGVVGATSNLGKAAATFGTSFLTTEADYYQESLDAGMSPQDAAIAGTYLAAQTALIESIIPDIKYFEPSAFRKSVTQGLAAGIKSGLPAKEAAKLAFKNAIKAVPASAGSIIKSGTKEAGEEILGQSAEDIGKEVINASSQREYFNDTFNVESYVDAIIGGFVSGGGLSVLSRPTPKSPIQESVIRDVVENRDRLFAQGTDTDRKVTPEGKKEVEDAGEILDAMKAHSGWNQMSREEQDHAFALAQQAEVMKKEQERMKELRIPDERKDAEIKRLEDEVNEMFSIQLEQEKQKAKDAKLKAIEDEFNKSMEGEEFPVQEDERDQEIVELQKQREERGINELDTFLSDMKPMVPFAVERTEQGLPVAQSVKQAASNYLYKKYKELTDMKSDPNRMMTRQQIASVQKQLEQDIRTLEGTAETKTETRDQENIQGIPSQVREGQEPVATQPVEVPSAEAPEAGRVLQAQEEVTPEAAPEVVVKPSRRERLAKMFETSEGEIAAEKVASFLGEANIGVDVLDAKSFEETGKQRNFEGDADGIFLVDNNTGKIYLNKERIKGAEGKTIAFHEGIHPVVNIIRNTNPKLYSAIVDGLKAEAVKNAGVAQAAADVAASEYYQEQGPSAIEDETVVETMARVAAGDIDIDTFEPSFREKFVEFMNKLAKMLGLKPIAVNSPRMEVKRLADQLSRALNEGGKLSDVVGKENITKFQNALAQARLTSKEIAERTESKTKAGEVQPSMELTAKKNKQEVVTYSGPASIEALRENKPEMYVSRALELSKTHLVKGAVRKFSSALTQEQKLKWADGIYAKAKETVVSNLLFVYDNIDPDVRNISKLWYDGANIIAQEMASKYGVSLEQASAVIATQSPQKPWFDNVHLAHFILDFYTNNENTIFEQSDFDYYKSKTVDGTGKPYPKQIAYLPDLKKAIGKPFSELNGYDKSAMIRSRFDQNYERNAPLRIPTGAIVDAKIKAPSSFSGYETILKAVSVLQDGSSKNISDNIGGAYKVRNFYNNIASPQTDGEVTIDTHAMAVAYMLPLGSSSKEVKFDEGTYSFFADAYREAAKQRGVLAREMQSITWEGARAIFPANQKTEKAKQIVKDIWADYDSGKITLQEAQDKIKTYGKDLSTTDWAGYVDAILDEDKTATYLKELPLSSRNKPAIEQRAEGGVDRGLPAVGKRNRKSVGQPSINIRRGKYEPLPGAPTPQGATGPIKELVDVAESYAKKFGVPYTRQGEYVQVDEAFAKRIADAYANMKHDPKDPKVKEAYDDLIRQTTDQYNALMDAGYEFTFFDSKTDPYKGNPMDAMRDLRANKKMAVYGTYDGYGTEGITGAKIEDNPMLAPTGLQWPDQSGKMHDVTANDLFRAVHDAFGHGLEGAGFRARGEENAWQAHARLFTGPAVAAITSETRGQNSWLNYGPFGEKNRRAKLEDTIFAEQKTGLMPEWTWTENVAPAMPSDEGRTEPVMVENAPEGTYLNIGLKEGMTNKMIPIKTVLSKLPKDVQVIESTSTQGTEPTAAIKISRKLTDEEMDKLLEDTKQLAIPQLSDGEGVIHGTKDWGDFNADFFVLPNGKKLSDVGAKKGQPSMVKRTSAEVQRLMEDSMDSVDEAIADGVDAQTAVEDNITSQDWYGELTPKQKEQFDEIIKDEFGVTPKAPVAKPTGVKATIANIIDNYYKLKDGDRSARAAINEILGQDPKLKYIYDNISKINKQLQDAGVITDKTDGCP